MATSPFRFIRRCAWAPPGVLAATFWLPLPLSGLSPPTTPQEPEPATTPLTAQEGEPDPDTTPTPPVPGSTLSVHLLTVEPGDAVWEVFGHNALVIRDPETADSAYNYGIFNFAAPGFHIRFLKGRMMYEVDLQGLRDMLAYYRKHNRRVWAQELDLEPVRKARLARLLRTAILPENRFYPYQYYLNNCSTKLRDALDTVLDGALRKATDGPPTGATWRQHTRRLTATHPLGYLGIDLVLGPKGDELTNRWQEMWIPMKLRDTAGALFLTRADGSRTPLVRSEEVWVDSTREPEPVAAPSLTALFLLVGLATALILTFLGYAAAAGSAPGRFALGLCGLLWGGFCFVAGVTMIVMYWTDHEFMYWNQSVLLFSPLGAGVAAGLLRVVRKGRTGLWGRRFVLGSLVLAIAALILNLIPATMSGNREMIAFALPVHLSLCWVMLGIHRMEHALVYGDSVSG